MPNKENEENEEKIKTPPSQVVTACSVFVRSIQDTAHGAIVVEASNGSLEGPPLVCFNLPSKDMKNCHIGKRYLLRIEEG